MLVAALLLAAVPQETQPPPTIEVAAWLEADTLTVGDSYAIQVELGLPDGVTLDQGGLPDALLQIDCPPSVKLAGPYYDTLAKQLKHDHLIMPYERLFDGTRSEVRFQLAAEPKADETVGLNVIGYGRGPGDAKPFFFRQRYELPLKPGGEAVHGDDANSHWGTDAGLLQIGDRLKPLELARLTGGTYDLADVVGKEPLLLTTYRAFW